MRFLLDTNIWRYLVDAGAIANLRRLAQRRNLAIQVAPSVVYEALRTSDPAVRSRLILALTSPEWQRLLPEAFTEASDLVSEFRRLRPSWIHPAPDLINFKRNLRDWRASRAGFWERVRMNPEKAAQQLKGVEHGLVDSARESLKHHKTQLREIDSSWETVDLSTLHVEPDYRLAPGWNGRPFAAWRAYSSETARLDIERAGRSLHPYSDWLLCFLHPLEFRSSGASWNSFWFHEADELRLRREWLRWATVTLLAFRASSPGAACDIQLASYLPESDCFISADRVLVEVFAKCRMAATFPLPETSLVASGNAGAEQTLEIVSAMSQ